MNTHNPITPGTRKRLRWALLALVILLAALALGGCSGGMFGGAPSLISTDDFNNIGKEMVAIEHKQPTFTYERMAPRRDEHGNLLKDQAGNAILQSVTLTDALDEQKLKDQVEKIEGQVNSDVKTLELARLNYILGYLAEFQKTQRNGGTTASVVYGEARDYYTKAAQYGSGYSSLSYYRLGVLGANGLLGPLSDSLNLAKMNYGRLRSSFGMPVWVRHPEVAGVGGIAEIALNTPPSTAAGPTLSRQDAAAVATERLDVLYRTSGGRDATSYHAIDIFIKFFNHLTPTYGAVIALFFLALLVKLITAPLTTMAFRGMRDMQRVQPLLKELQVKYKDDKQKQAEEQMRIMREHKVKPMGGCLPMIIQLPIFLIVYSAVQLYLFQFSKSHFIWIHNLAQPDWILLILYSISLIITQKLTATPSTDPQQQAIQNQMTYFMPVFMLLVLKTIASAFVLYWFFLNVLSSIHQYYLMRHFRMQEAAAAEAAAQATPPPAPGKKKRNQS